MRFENLAKSLNYPILFGYFGDLAKFSRILHEYKILSEHSHFISYLAMVGLLLWPELELIVAKFLRKKKKQVRKYYIFLKYPRKFG